MAEGDGIVRKMEGNIGKLGEVDRFIRERQTKEIDLKIDMQIIAEEIKYI